MTVSQDVNLDHSEKYVKLARKCVFGLYVMSVVWGIIQVVFPDNGVIYILSTLLFAFLASGWLAFDAKIHGIKIVPVLQMLHFFFWPIGAIIYLLFRSKLRGIFVYVVHGFGLCLTFTTSFFGTFYGSHFMGMLDSRYYQ